MDANTWYEQGGGGGSDIDIYFGITGGIVRSMELSYLSDAKQVLKYGKRIDGKVRSAETLTRANRISSTATAKYLGYAGKALGIYSAYQHGRATIDAFNEGEYEEMFLNIGKTGVDAFFILNKSVNPIWFGLSVGYTVFDIYTTKP